MLKIADRAKEATTTTGTGAVTLGGAASGALAIGAVVADGDQVPYCIDGGAEWEVGIGTYTASGNTLTRSTVLASSNAAALVSFSAGTKSVFVTIPAVVAAGGLLPIPFAAAIPFRMSGAMPTQSVTGAIAFTPDNTGAIDGVQVVVDLLANGTNIPTFTGFREWDGSSGWVNTANVRNCVTFFRRGGASWYTINQQAGAPTESLPATALTLAGPSGGVTGVASTNFTVAANGTLATSVIVTPGDGGAGGTFTPTTRTLTSGSTSATFTYTPGSTGAKTISVANDGGLTNPGSLTYTVTASATAPGAPTGLTVGTVTETTVALSWTVPSSTGGASITDYVVQHSPTGAGTWTTFSDGTSTGTTATVTGLTALTGYDFRVAAVNSVGTGSYSSTATGTTLASGLQPLRMLSLANMTESGDGTAGWTYTATGTISNAASVSEKKLASGTDGWVQFKVGHTPSGSTLQVYLGVGTNAAAQLYSGTFEMMLAADVYSFLIGPSNFLAYSSPYTNLAVAADDIMRLERSGSNLLHKISKDGGDTFSTYRTTTAPTGDLYFYVAGQASGVAEDVRHSGLVTP